MKNDRIERLVLTLFYAAVACAIAGLIVSLREAIDSSRRPRPEICYNTIGMPITCGARR